MEPRPLSKLFAAVAPLRLPPAPPEDIAAFHAYARGRSFDLGVTLTLILLADAFLTWPSDRLIFRGDPATQVGLAWWRFEVIATLAVTLVLARLWRWARDHQVHSIVIVAVFGTLLTGWGTSPLGGPTRPMLYSQYLIPMCTLAMLVPLRARVVLVGLMFVSAMGSTVLADPAVVRMTGFFVYVLTLASSCGLAVFAGHAIFHLFRLSFLQRQALSRTAGELAALDRAKSEFFANVSHELRTPLTLILASLRAAGAAGGPAEAREAVKPGLRNAARLLLLVNEILELARLEGGARPVNVRPVDLAAMIRRTVSDFDSRPDGGSSFTLVGADGPVLVSGSAQRLKKVFYNLVSNAVKFTDPARRAIRVELRAGPREVTVVVADNGIGIPEKDLGRIFERFVQLDATLARRYEGTGIGLALVKEIVTQAGGRVEVESKVGEGSTFTVTLPRGDVGSLTAAAPAADEDEDLGWLGPEAEEVTSEAPRSDEDDAGDARPRVLVVEDNVELSRYMRRLLQPRYRVDVARNGREGLARARAAPPDLVLSDVMMPEMNGVALLRALRADDALSAIPVIFLTARAGLEPRVEALEEGADDYVSKPFEERELLARVENLLDKRRKARELEALNDALEARVAARTEELRALAAHLSDVLERERARIARDIHDELGQTLSAMRLEVEHAARDLAITDPMREALGRTGRLLELTLTTTRRILTQLRPRVLDDFGLIAAVEWLAEEFRAHHRKACELSVDPDLDTDPGRATALFRILQECLNNVAKHAAADRVEVSLARDGDVLRLVVRDDGRGMPAEIRAGAMGVLGMRERAWQYGGRVDVTGAPGRGTTVDVEIPATGPPRSARSFGADGPARSLGSGTSSGDVT